jgi:hypothetical protein
MSINRVQNNVSQHSALNTSALRSAGVMQPADIARLKRAFWEFDSPLPHRECPTNFSLSLTNDCDDKLKFCRTETGMNAKRSRDRFFKPALESSSLSIPAV